MSFSRVREVQLLLFEPSNCKFGDLLEMGVAGIFRILISSELQELLVQNFYLLDIHARDGVDDQHSTFNNPYTGLQDSSVPSTSSHEVAVRFMEHLCGEASGHDLVWTTAAELDDTYIEIDISGQTVSIDSVDRQIASRQSHLAFRSRIGQPRLQAGYGENFEVKDSITVLAFVDDPSIKIDLVFSLSSVRCEQR